MTPVAASHPQLLRVRATRAPYRRAGFRFGTTVDTLELRIVDHPPEKLLAICTDPALIVHVDDGAGGLVRLADYLSRLEDGDLGRALATAHETGVENAMFGQIQAPSSASAALAGTPRLDPAGADGAALSFNASTAPPAGVTARTELPEQVDRVALGVVDGEPAAPSGPVSVTVSEPETSGRSDGDAVERDEAEREIAPETADEAIAAAAVGAPVAVEGRDPVAAPTVDPAAEPDSVPAPKPPRGRRAS